jgi:hypothetical protein
MANTSDPKDAPEPTDTEVEASIVGKHREMYDERDGPASRRKTIFEFHKNRLIQARKRDQENLQRELEQTGKALDLVQRLQEDPTKAHLLPPPDITTEELHKWFDEMSKPQGRPDYGNPPDRELDQVVRLATDSYTAAKKEALASLEADESPKLSPSQSPRKPIASDDEIAHMAKIEKGFQRFELAAGEGGQAEASAAQPGSEPPEWEPAPPADDTTKAEDKNKGLGVSYSPKIPWLPIVDTPSQFAVGGDNPKSALRAGEPPADSGMHMPHKALHSGSLGGRAPEQPPKTIAQPQDASDPKVGAKTHDGLQSGHLLHRWDTDTLSAVPWDGSVRIREDASRIKNKTNKFIRFLEGPFFLGGIGVIVAILALAFWGALFILAAVLFMAAIIRADFFEHSPKGKTFYNGVACAGVALATFAFWYFVPNPFAKSPNEAVIKPAPFVPMPSPSLIVTPESQSYLIIKPQLLLNKNEWSFLIEHRGNEPLFNVQGVVRDLDRFQATTQRIQRGGFSERELAELTKGTETVVKAPEIDPGNKSYEALRTFYIKPFSPLHAHFSVYITYREGSTEYATEQTLRIESVGTDDAGAPKIQYATRIIDSKSRGVLIECKDPEFRSDGEWSAALQPCFPYFLAPPPATP